MEFTVNTNTFTTKPSSVCGVNFFNQETNSVWREEWYGMKYQDDPTEATPTFERLAACLEGEIDEVQWFKDEKSVVACILYPLPSGKSLN
jgi:hypothetical protein